MEAVLIGWMTNRFYGSVSVWSREMTGADAIAAGRVLCRWMLKSVDEHGNGSVCKRVFDFTVIGGVGVVFLTKKRLDFDCSQSPDCWIRINSLTHWFSIFKKAFLIGWIICGSSLVQAFDPLTTFAFASMKLRWQMRLRLGELTRWERCLRLVSQTVLGWNADGGVKFYLDIIFYACVCESVCKRVWKRL